jgi:hypothetical protein
MTKRTLRMQLDRAHFDVRAEHLAGVYLPIIAEALGETALHLEQRLDRRLRGTRLEWLLWTQYVVVSPG